MTKCTFIYKKREKKTPSLAINPNRCCIIIQLTEETYSKLRAVQSESKWKGIKVHMVKDMKQNDRIIYMIYIESLCTNGAMYPLQC